MTAHILSRCDMLNEILKVYGIVYIYNTQFHSETGRNASDGGINENVHKNPEKYIKLMYNKYKCLHIIQL